MRLRLNISEGYGTEVEIDASGMLYDPSQSPLTAKETFDLGGVSVAFPQKHVDDALGQIERLEELATAIEEVLDELGPRAKHKAAMAAWKETVEDAAEKLRETIGDLDGEGRRVEAILEVIQ
jgi:ElaB/YqjD/DUF883 family membrane-anchored ribosome-binding protein